MYRAIINTHNIRTIQTAVHKIMNSPRMPNNNKKIIIAGTIILGIIIVNPPLHTTHYLF
jgi:hypothetical protein